MLYLHNKGLEHAMINRIWAYIKESLWIFVTILFPIILGIDNINEFLNENYYRWVFALVLILLANVMSFKNFESKKELTDTISELTDRNENLVNHLESVPISMIKTLSINFKFENDSRITLYRVKPNETFIPVARFSKSPIYRKMGRLEYPIDSGFIGKCWVEGKAQLDKLADYSKSPKRYVSEAMKQGGMTEAEIHNLSMKSRSFYCKRLDYNGDEPIAVLVFESMQTTLPQNIEVFNKYLEGPFGKVLIDTVNLNIQASQDGGSENG